jgi:hypothetical protein
VARASQIGSGVDDVLKAIGDRLAAFLSRDGHAHSASPPTNQEFLKRCLRRGDVMLVEGTSIISTAIKYLTQSTWSHAALCIDEHRGDENHPEGGCVFVEADLQAGVRRVELGAYSGYHCRICRPVGLSANEVDQVVAYAIGHVGHGYDTRNIVDLARYLLPTPPVPTSWRRKMIALGSGDPTRAICSGLVAQSFQCIDYPVLPDVTYFPSTSETCPGCMDELMHVRHHSLFVPRDFDVSPYFQIVKPSLIDDFNYHTLNWAKEESSNLPAPGLS